jgi:hypothetical protein
MRVKPAFGSSSSSTSGSARRARLRLSCDSAGGEAVGAGGGVAFEAELAVDAGAGVAFGLLAQAVSAAEPPSRVTERPGMGPTVLMSAVRPHCAERSTGWPHQRRAGAGPAVSKRHGDRVAGCPRAISAPPPARDLAVTAGVAVGFATVFGVAAAAFGAWWAASRSLDRRRLDQWTREGERMEPDWTAATKAHRSALRHTPGAASLAVC